MKLFVLIALCVALHGQSSATPFFSKMTSALTGGVDLARGLTTSTIGAGMNIAKGATDLGVNAAKSTVNAGVGAVKATADAGVGVVKYMSTGAVNNGIELFLATTRNMASASGKGSLDVPDINQKIGPAKFNATKGFFSDISTLVKDGNANVTLNGTSIVIDIPVKMGQIDLGYGEFKASMLFLNFGGGIKIHIAENQFIIRVIVKPGLTCTINVEKVTVAKLDGIEVKFHDMGKTSEKVFETVGNLLVKALKGMIKQKVQEAVDSKLKETLKENSSICSKFLG